MRMSEPRPASSRSSTSHSRTLPCHSVNESKSVSASMILSAGALTTSVSPPESLPMSDPFDDRACREGTTAAHRDEGGRAVAPLQFVQCRGNQASTGAADRMPDRDGTAVDVHLVRIRAVHLHP